LENVRSWVVFGAAAAVSPLRRRLQMLLNVPPLQAYAVASALRKPSYESSGSALLQDLPPQVHLLSLNTRPNGTVILRFAHLFEANESALYSQPVTVSWSSYFNLTASDVTERSLTGVIELSQMNRAQWTSTAGVTPPSFPASLQFVNSQPVFTLAPHDVRTYYVTLG